MHMLFNAFDITVSNILSLGLCADMSGFNVDGDAAFSKTFWMGFFFNSGVKKKKKKRHVYVNRALETMKQEPHAKQRCYEPKENEKTMRKKLWGENDGKLKAAGSSCTNMDASEQSMVCLELSTKWPQQAMQRAGAAAPYGVTPEHSTFLKTVMNPSLSSGSQHLSLWAASRNKARWHLGGALAQLMQPRPIQWEWQIWDSFEVAEFEKSHVNQVLSPTHQLTAEVFASTCLNLWF